MEKPPQPAPKAQEQNTLIRAGDDGTVARLPENVISAAMGWHRGGRELQGFISDQASFDAGSHPAEATLLPHPTPLSSSSERRTDDSVSPDSSPLSPGDADSLARGERRVGVLT